MTKAPPSNLRIGPYTYTVHATAEAWRELRADDTRAHESWGYSDVAQLALWVDPGGPERHPIHTKDTLLHEVLHQCFHVTGAKRISDDDEELVVACIAPMLLGVLRDNPELVAYLTEKP